MEVKNIPDKNLIIDLEEEDKPETPDQQVNESNQILEDKIPNKTNVKAVLEPLKSKEQLNSRSEEALIKEWNKTNEVFPLKKFLLRKLEINQYPEIVEFWMKSYQDEKSQIIALNDDISVIAIGPLTIAISDLSSSKIKRVEINSLDKTDVYIKMVSLSSCFNNNFLCI